ncbi:MAG TPA: NADH-quinone oxidoreductase subunit C, partial [Myxococcales bacterium]|nr:NADH-quinone oxidoreductase subunit C [Myxococcales bacterium]
GFELLVDLSATDPAKESAELWINVQLLSLAHRHRLAIKCLLPKAEPRLPSCAPVHRAAQWHERECAEMFGITFEGHPDPRHILLPDDWVGHPLRKDYAEQAQYHQISTTRESPLDGFVRLDEMKKSAAAKAAAAAAPPAAEPKKEIPS